MGENAHEILDEQAGNLIQYTKAGFFVFKRCLLGKYLTDIFQVDER